VSSGTWVGKVLRFKCAHENRAPDGCGVWGLWACGGVRKSCRSLDERVSAQGTFKVANCGGKLDCGVHVRSFPSERSAKKCSGRKPDESFRLDEESDANRRVCVALISRENVVPR